ncbi:MAG: hypothetical protein HDR11_17555 [Lachnospiraceae bacterium]|nr:hypothetical protein [Lachnospiraceae bacterium]MBD5499524.1 hypothetical protein [Lachnospiraceae bacterium]
MQERDVIKIKSEFVTDIVSKQIERILKNKTGYEVDIQIGTLKIVNEDEKTYFNLEGKAEINSKDLKKICKNNSFLINIVLNSPTALLNMFLNGMLKNKYGCKVDFHIKDKKFSEKHGKSRIYLDTDIKIKTKELQKILKNTNLI